jgi:hypothetical protein
VHHHDRPPAANPSVLVPDSAVYLLDAEIAQREIGRRLEWLAVRHPDLYRTARTAFWVAQRIRGDRLAIAA